MIDHRFALLIILVNCFSTVYLNEINEKPNLGDTDDHAEELKLQAKEDYANNELGNTSKFVVVCIKDGCLRGYRKSYFDAFLSIPYATPPLGSRRFSNPIPNEPYTEDIRNATKITKCIQKDLDSLKPVLVGTEDCLYLNVYRQKGVRRNSNMSVFVHIHGGVFSMGSASPTFLGPDYLMENSESIMVTINYRLGVLGFMSTVDENSPGNFGLKDQSLALKWVKKNIKHFGGDPNSITLIGHSSGAMLVQMHMMSPASEGYFHRAILLSSTAISPYNYPTKDPLALARRQAEVLGVNDTHNMSNRDLVETLRNFDAVDLIESAIKLKFWSVYSKTCYRPVIEKDLPGAFMTTDPRIIWQNGDFKAVPYIISFVENEGSDVSHFILRNDTLMAEFTERFDEIMSKFLENSIENVEERDWVLGRIKDFYFNGTSDVSYNLGQSLTQFFTDFLYNFPQYCSIFQFLQYSNPKITPLTIYKFDFKGPLSYSKLFAPGYDYGITHADDIIYFYRVPESFRHQLSPFTTEYKMMQVLIKTYDHFAKHGVAKKWVHVNECHMEYRSQMDKNLPKFCEYQRFSRANDNSVQINVSNKFRMDAMEFWHSIIEFAEKRTVLNSNQK